MLTVPSYKKSNSDLETRREAKSSVFDAHDVSPAHRSAEEIWFERGICQLGSGEARALYRSAPGDEEEMCNDRRRGLLATARKRGTYIRTIFTSAFKAWREKLAHPAQSTSTPRRLRFDESFRVPANGPAAGQGHATKKISPSYPNRYNPFSSYLLVCMSWSCGWRKKKKKPIYPPPSTYPPRSLFHNHKKILLIFS